MTRNASLVSKLCRLGLLLALVLIPFVHQAQATSTNPCPKSACGYTWDPVSRCCITDPRFDCFDICY